MWASAVVLLLLVACASPPPERSVLAGNPARTLLVLPLNVPVVMPPELESVSPRVWRELEVYLREHEERRLKTASFADARRLWVASIREARAQQGARAGFDEAMRILVQKLAQYAEFDALVVPSLYLRKALVSGRTARWDGVSRPLEIEAHGFAARTLTANTPFDGIAPAASLHAVVVDAEGNKLQESIGGLELLVRVNAAAAPDVDATEGASRCSGPSVGGELLCEAPGVEVGFEFEPRTDLFGAREHLREGIGLALDPFLPLR